MSEYFVGTTGVNSQTTFESLTTSEVLDDLQLNTTDSPTFADVTANAFYGDGSNLTGLSSTDNTKLPLAGGTLTGDLTVNGKTILGDALTDKAVVHGHLGIGHDDYPKIAYPGQNALWGESNNTTVGQVVIDLPGTLANYDMAYMEIDIYEYNSTNATKLIIGGHNWNSGGTSNTSSTMWHNAGVTVIGGNPKSVYLGWRNDGTNNRRVIAIGETNSTWNYPTIHVAKVHGNEGYSDGIDWVGDWAMNLTTSGSFFTKSPTTNFNTSSSTTFKTHGKISANGATFADNVGIGTTSPSAELEVEGSIGIKRIGVTATSTIDMGGNFNFDAESGYSHVFKQAGSEVVRILPSGNVGIGTTSPEANLHILKNSANGQAYERLIIDGDTQSTTASGSSQAITFKGSGDVYAGAVGSYGNGTVGGVGLWGGSTNSGSPDVFVKDGNVGIGTTSPDFKLDVAGDIGMDGKLYHNGDHNTYIGFESDNIKLRTGGTDAITINSSQNVGIGTDSPSYKLSVSGGDFGVPNGSKVYIGGSIGDSVIGYLGNTSGKFTLNSDGNRDVIIGSGTVTDAVSIKGTNGNVGIGTTSPDTNLEIGAATNVAPKLRLTLNDSGSSIGLGQEYGSIQWKGNDGQGDGVRADIRVFGEGSSGQTYMTLGTMPAGTSASTAAQERMRITSGGNVGIGTTNPSGELHVKSASGNANLYIQRSVYDSWRLSAGSTYLAFMQAASEKMRITETGNVGIGTASPTSPLTIKSNSVSSADSGFTLQANADTNALVKIGERSNNKARLHMYASGVEKIAFYTDGTANHISAGNVGIGTTSPEDKLDIVGQLRISDNKTANTNKTNRIRGEHYNIAEEPNTFMFMNSFSTTNTLNVGGGSSIENAATQLNFYTAANNTTTTGSARMSITDAGNVGIGTTNPSSLLHLESASSPSLQLKDTTQGTTLKAFSQDSNAHLGTFSNHPLVFDTNSTERMRITSAGNVGIGTTNPSQKLEVYGSAKVDSSLWVNNSNGNAQVNAYSGGKIGTYLAKSSSATANFTITGVSYSRGLGFGAIIGVGNTTDIPVNNASWSGGYGGNIGFWSDVHYGTENGTNSIGFNAVIKGSGGSNSYGFFSDLSGATSGTRYGIYTKGEQQNYFSGNVGIGTTSPSYRLSVDDNSVTNIPKTLLQFDASSIADNGGYNIDFRTSSNDLANRYVARIRGIRESSGALSQLSFWTESGSALEQRMTIRASGNVGIGTTTPSAKLEVNGHFAATTKSFIIDNPKTDGRLQYGVVETDEHSVYVRGKSDQEEIQLPEEWEWLVHEDSVTALVTAVGQTQRLFVIEETNKKITVGGLADGGRYNYVVYGTRKDVDALEKHLK